MKLKNVFCRVLCCFGIHMEWKWTVNQCKNESDFACSVSQNRPPIEARCVYCGKRYGDCRWI